MYRTITERRFRKEIERLRYHLASKLLTKNLSLDSFLIMIKRLSNILTSITVKDPDDYPEFGDIARLIYISVRQVLNIKDDLALSDVISDNSSIIDRVTHTKMLLTDSEFRDRYANCTLECEREFCSKRYVFCAYNYVIIRDSVLRVEDLRRFLKTCTIRTVLGSQESCTAIDVLPLNSDLCRWNYLMRIYNEYKEEKAGG